MYEFRDPHVADKWEARINDVCTKDLGNNKDISQLALKNISIVALSTGALLGITFSYHKLKHK